MIKIIYTKFEKLLRNSICSNDRGKVSTLSSPNLLIFHRLDLKTGFPFVKYKLNKSIGLLHSFNTTPTLNVLIVHSPLTRNSHAVSKSKFNGCRVEIRNERPAPGPREKFGVEGALLTLMTKNLPTTLLICPT